MPEWETQRAHRYYVQEDVLFWESHGLITLVDVKLVFSLRERVNRLYGYSLAVFDARDKVSVQLEARRHIIEQGRTSQLRTANAIIGAGMTLATIMRLLQNAYRLLGLTPPATHYCVTLEEAWTLIQTERQRMRAALPAGTI
jgi:hypothetical protein